MLFQEDMLSFRRRETFLFLFLQKVTLGNWKGKHSYASRFIYFLAWICSREKAPIPHCFLFLAGPAACGWSVQLWEQSLIMCRERGCPWSSNFGFFSWNCRDLAQTLRRDSSRKWLCLNLTIIFPCLKLHLHLHIDF